MDNSEKQINYLRHNAGIYGVNERIDYFLGDFLRFKVRKQVDLVFLNPTCVYKKNDNEAFSLFKHIQPDLIEIMIKTWEISHNFILLLPRFYDFTEIPLLFSEFLPFD